VDASRSDSNPVVWEVFAQAWADTEFEAADFEYFARQLRETGLDEASLQNILDHQVCGAFALYSLALLFSAGLALPPFLFPEDEACQRVQTWLARPRWQYRLNPLWWLGRGLARGMAREHWQAIRLRLRQPCQPHVDGVGVG